VNWVFFTLGAVVLQTVRNALQSQLSASMSTSGVTLARFLFAPPIALVYLSLLYGFSDQIIPDFSLNFIALVFAAAILQILATALMVILFKQKNFTIGAGLAKSEALVAGILGTFFFGSQLSLFGWLGIILGGLAVFVLSGWRPSKKASSQLSLNTVLTGLACGTCFALTSLFVREASLTLNVPFPHSAAWVLVWVLCIQTTLLSSYILIKTPSTFIQIKNKAKMTLATSIASCFGTICWFSAMSLQHVAYVKTLGQIEVALTMLIAVYWLKQKVQKYEVVGLLLIAVAAILVMWA
jgi:drug/metabolite transporter (DMT)-like permease